MRPIEIALTNILTSSPLWKDGDSQTSRFGFLFLSLAGFSQQLSWAQCLSSLTLAPQAETVCPTAKS
ncbi:MAG: hypothetical protein J7642_17110, partial [Cyanobacteria bacterium SBC]|nr:hypothetical protein [Cyanobacteria bacterium SBC]